LVSFARPSHSRPAMAGGIYSANLWKCAVVGLDSRFRGNDRRLEWIPIPNDTSTQNWQGQTLLELPPKLHGYCPGTGRHRIFCQKRSGFHWEGTNTARSAVSGAYKLSLPATVLGASRRPQRLVRQPHKILRLQQTGNRNVFVDGLPVKNDRREQRGFAMALVPRDCKKRIGNHESAKASAQNEFTTFLHDR
jgi:hypothetical protein